MIWATFMTTCAAREKVREQTLSLLRSTDWGQEPELVIDEGQGKTIRQRIYYTHHRMLERASKSDADVVLLLEDDLDFHIGLRAHVETWSVFASRTAHFFGSLYNPGMFDTVRVDDRTLCAQMVRKPWGAQAIVMNQPTLRYILRFWNQALFGYSGDLRMYALAHKVTPVYFHCPSLVQHVGHTTWGWIAHRADDFRKEAAE